MRFDIITIFPDFFRSPFEFGVIKRAQEKGIIRVCTHDLRSYTCDRHRTVDDKPYGGGAGMVLKPEPLGKAIEDVRDLSMRSIVVLATPQGERFDDKMARELAAYEQIVIVCGRYEGVDERIREIYVDREISIGDFIVTGGEYAAAVIVDAVSRYHPAVLGNENSSDTESFRLGLLEHAQYTRPEEYRGLRVPQVLLSGNHREIEEWRRRDSLRRTYLRRPDLLDRSSLSAEDYEFIKGLRDGILRNFRVYIALVHYPVYNKNLDVIKTAFTNLDVHDIARAARTYGVQRFYLIHPVEQQRKLVERVIAHWRSSSAMEQNPSRFEALRSVVLKATLEEAVSEIEGIEGRKPKIVATDARYMEGAVGYGELRRMIFENSESFLILFGTGWGLTKEVMGRADYILKPISGYTDYNHLSVRSAASIILDRLLSE
jgi:tRNA (guanine37-N1)-methyltransferase